MPAGTVAANPNNFVPADFEQMGRDLPDFNKLAKTRKLGDIREQLKDAGLTDAQLKQIAKAKDPKKIEEILGGANALSNREQMQKLSKPSAKNSIDDVSDVLADMKKGAKGPNDPLSLKKNASPTFLTNEEYQKELKRYNNAPEAGGTKLSVLDNGSFATAKVTKPGTNIVVPLSQYGYQVPISSRVKIERVPGPNLVWKLSIAGDINSEKSERTNVIYVPAQLASEVNISTVIKGADGKPQQVSRSISEISEMEGNPKDVQVMKAAENKWLMQSDLTHRFMNTRRLAQYYRLTEEKIDENIRSFLTSGVKPEHQSLGKDDGKSDVFSVGPIFDSSALDQSKPTILHFNGYDKDLIKESKEQLMKGPYQESLRKKLDEFAAGKAGALITLKANEYIAVTPTHDTNFKADKPLTVEFTDAKTGKVIRSNTFDQGFVFTRKTYSELKAALQGKIKGLKAKVTKGSLKDIEPLKMYSVYSQDLVGQKAADGTYQPQEDELKGVFFMPEKSELIVAKDLNSGLTTTDLESGVDTNSEIVSSEYLQKEYSKEKLANFKAPEMQEFLDDIDLLASRPGDSEQKEIITTPNNLIEGDFSQKRMAA